MLWVCVCVYFGFASVIITISTFNSSTKSCNSGSLLVRVSTFVYNILIALNLLFRELSCSHIQVDIPWVDHLLACKPWNSYNYHTRRSDMLQVYKIMKGIRRLESNQIFSLADISNTRGHSLKLVKRRSRSSLRQSVFSQRVTNDWNGSTAHAVDSPTLNTFKSRLDKHWKGALQSAVIHLIRNMLHRNKTWPELLTGCAITTP